MNNVGALALLMPVAVQIAARLELPPGKVLMPLAFASILGGTTTLIGTPPNLIISGFRAYQSGHGGFAMFDFGLAGVPLTLAGLAFIALIGWRMVPARAQPGAAGFDTGAYLTEARVPEGSKAAGMRLREIELELDAADAQIVGLVRNDVKMNAPSGGRIVRAGDILVIEAEVGALPGVLSALGLELEEAAAAPAPADSAAGAAPEDTGAPADEGPARRERGDDLVLMELVVRPESALAGRSASDLLLRSRYGLNLLAVSRDGARARARLRTLRLRPGDLLLMQGPSDTLAEFAGDFGCVPLAERELRIPDRGKAITASLIMIAAVAVAGARPAALGGRLRRRRARLDGAAHGAATRGVRGGGLASDRAPRCPAAGRRRDAIDRRRRPRRPPAARHPRPRRRGDRPRPHPGHHHGAHRPDEQRRHRRGDGADRHGRRCPARRQPRHLPDGGGDRRLVRLS